MTEAKEDKKTELLWRKINEPFFNYAKMNYTYVIWYVESGVINLEKSPVITHRHLHERELAALKLSNEQKFVYSNLINKSKEALTHSLRDKGSNFTGWVVVDLHSKRRFELSNFVNESIDILIKLGLVVTE